MAEMPPGPECDKLMEINRAISRRIIDLPAQGPGDILVRLELLREIFANDTWWVTGLLDACIRDLSAPA